MPNQVICRTILFSGHVQGVGFRYTTRQMAERIGIFGTVENLADGRVRAIVEGTGSQLDQFLQAVSESGVGHVRQVESSETGASGQFSGFQILH